MSLYVDDRDLRQYRRALEQLGRNDFPIAVRNALNKTAKHAKQKTIASVMRDKFIVRRPAFIRSHTSYAPIPYSELNINRMTAKAGFVRGKSRAGDQMKLQEKGGTISQRNVPFESTRVANSAERKQKAKFFYKHFRNKRKGVYRDKGRRFFRITDKSVQYFTESANGEIKNRVTLYLLRRSIRIPKTPFTKEVGLREHRNIQQIFIREANERIRRRAERNGLSM